jgi:hypothetical protein
MDKSLIIPSARKVTHQLLLQQVLQSLLYLLQVQAVYQVLHQAVLQVLTTQMGIYKK